MNWILRIYEIFHCESKYLSWFLYLECGVFLGSEPRSQLSLANRFSFKPWWWVFPIPKSFILSRCFVLLALVMNFINPGLYPRPVAYPLGLSGDRNQSFIYHTLSPYHLKHIRSPCTSINYNVIDLFMNLEISYTSNVADLYARWWFCLMLILARGRVLL